MAEHRVRKGLDIPLAGKPAPTISDAPAADRFVVYPPEYSDVKQRLLVNLGDAVRRGSALVEDKQNPEFKIRAPAAGRVEVIDRGERRLVERIVIRFEGQDAAESFGKYTPAEMGALSREAILAQLTSTGYLALIRQRPFSSMADAHATPRAIFVNAMSTAPFQADANVVVKDDPAAFRAGVALLRRLTAGKVYVCAGPGAIDEIQRVEGAETHLFHGPHPAGNTSVHISRISPLKKGDMVWTVRAVDLVLIGRLFLDGQLPRTRLVAVGGPGVKAEACLHYRVRMGASLEGLWKTVLAPGEQRRVNGDALSGERMEAESALGFFQSSITVLPEGRERHLLGWLAPGLSRYSFSKAFAAPWLPGKPAWAMNTNLNGGRRAIVLTGLYDRVMPLNILVDFLTKAVLAGDWDEAIQLGILETAPEDFALCDYVCPCKTEVQEIIRQGLRQIRKEEAG